MDSAKSLEKEILGLLHGRDLWSEFWLAEAEEEEVAEEEYMSKHAMGVVETTALRGGEGIWRINELFREGVPLVGNSYYNTQSRCVYLYANMTDCCRSR